MRLIKVSVRRPRPVRGTVLEASGDICALPQHAKGLSRGAVFPLWQDSFPTLYARI